MQRRRRPALKRPRRNRPAPLPNARAHRLPPRPPPKAGRSGAAGSAAEISGRAALAEELAPRALPGLWIGGDQRRLAVIEDVVLAAVRVPAHAARFTH